MGRIAALDFGLKRIGMAISDPRKIVATPLPKILNDKKVVETLVQTLSSYHPIENIVLGLPLLFNGKEGDMALFVRQFAEKLQPHFSILFWDERLTSAQAEKALKEASLSRKKRSLLIDSVSAMFILQSYLDSLG